MRTLEGFDIFIGSEKDALNHSELINNNIRILICVSEDAEVPKYSDIITTKWGMSDPETSHITNNCLDNAIELFNMCYTSALRLNGGVLCYCSAGHNRSAITVAGWLCKYTYMPLNEAAELCSVKDNKEWMKSLGFTFSGI